jgi:hypothetical protein
MSRRALPHVLKLGLLVSLVLVVLALGGCGGGGGGGQLPENPKGYYIKYSGDEGVEFSSIINDAQEVEGTTPHVEKVKEASIEEEVQVYTSNESDEGRLTVQILEDGKVVRAESTSKLYGAIDLRWIVPQKGDK